MTDGSQRSATHPGAPPHWTIALGTVLHWPEAHLIVLSLSSCSPFVQKDIMRNLLRCPAETQIHCICSISSGKRLIWSDYSWTHVSISWFLLPSPNSRTPDFHNQYIGQILCQTHWPEVRDWPFFGNQNWNSLFCGFRNHFHSYTESHSLIQQVFIDLLFFQVLYFRYKCKEHSPCPERTHRKS